MGIDQAFQVSIELVSLVVVANRPEGQTATAEQLCVPQGVEGSILLQSEPDSCLPVSKLCQVATLVEAVTNHIIRWTLMYVRDKKLFLSFAVG